MQRIAADRDKLRDLISDYEEIADSADMAVTEMEHALDTLSQYI